MVYKKQIETAKRLINKFGTQATLLQVSEVPNPDRPWEAQTVTIENPCEVVVFPVQNNAADLNEASVFEYEEVMYISPTLRIKPKPNDTVRIVNINYVIKNVKEINPNTTETILYICGVTK